MGRTFLGRQFGGRRSHLRLKKIHAITGSWLKRACLIGTTQPTLFVSFVGMPRSLLTIYLQNAQFQNTPGIVTLRPFPDQVQTLVSVSGWFWQRATNHPIRIPYFNEIGKY